MSASIQNITNVFAATSGTHANSATTLGGNNLHGIWNGDSYISGYGNFSKITLYIARTNDLNEFPRNSDGTVNMSDVSVTDSSGKPLFVKFGKSIIDKENYNLPTTSYVNLDTCKYDTLIDFKSNTKRAPAYKTKISDSQVKSIGLPEWLKADNSSNQSAVVNWITDTANASQMGTDRFKNLTKIIIRVAETSDASSATGLSAVNNMLASTKAKTTFDYKDAKEQEINLAVSNVMPWTPTGTDTDEVKGIAYWIVVYEPVLYYVQDPNKMFYPRSGGNSFLMSASDAILTNMYSGTSNYPSIVKFGTGTPALQAAYNHCNIDGTTWFGYPSWKNSSLPLATYDPLPCPGVTKDYDGVKYITRYPFAMTSAMKAAGKTFSVSTNWLQYKGGFLMDKPTGSMEDLIASAADVNNILQYGGYSAFLSAPIEAKPQAVDESYFVRVVGVNKDHTFTAIPGVTVELATKDEIKTAALRTQTETEAKKWINTQKSEFRAALTSNFNSIKNGTLFKSIVSGTDYVPVAYTEVSGGEKVGFSELLTNYKVFPRAIREVTPPPMPNYDITDYIGKLMMTGDYTSIAQVIHAYIGAMKDAADALKIVDQDGTITLDDGTRIGKDEALTPDWNKLVVFASEDKNINSIDKINTNNAFFYDTENNGWKIPDGFTFTGKKLYLTVIVAVVEAPLPGAVPDGNVIKENELLKAMQSDAISRVTVEKTSSDTTCPGYTSVWHSGYTDSDGDYHEGYYTYPNCGHAHTLQNAKGVIPNSLSVQTAWYWDATMFNGVSKLSALRKGGALTNDGVTFVFNTTSPFTASNMSDAFGGIVNEYKLMTHRNADPNNNGSVKPLQLAAYMNGTTLNSNYLTFINPYYGGTYPSAYNNPTGFFGENNFDLTTSINLPQNATAIGTGVFCQDNSTGALNIPTKLSGEISFGATSEKSTQFKTYTPIKIKETVKSANKSSSPFKTNSLYWGIDPNDDVNPSYHIQVQSDKITFNPAFKMKYQSSNDIASPFKEVWMLAAGEKTFISNDYVKIELTNSNLKVTSPWSRDSEDKVDESGNVRTTPTAKAGSTIKASANGTTVQVDVFYHVQDPNFVDPSQRAAVQSRNDAKAKQYDDMVTNISNQFKSNGVSFYSNMFQSTTSNTLEKVASPSNFTNLTSKTALKLASSVTSTITSQAKAYYVDVNGIADYTKPTRTITLNGTTIAAKDRWVDISAVKSEDVLSSILEQNGGVSISGWYNEDYEGILVIKKTYIIVLNGVETSYAQIHPQHSDSHTERNELAQPLKFVGGPEVLIQDNYGIGVEYRLPTLNINGQSFSNIVIPSKAFLFDIRGSIYDIK